MLASCSSRRLDRSKVHGRTIALGLQGLRVLTERQREVTRMENGCPNIARLGGDNRGCESQKRNVPPRPIELSDPPLLALSFRRCEHTLRGELTSEKLVLPIGEAGETVVLTED